jgi:pimeloyl-ACP methyl ester carboxylesterase
MTMRTDVARRSRRPGRLFNLLRGVAVLGGLALANHVAARRSERRHPPTGRFLHIDGVRLHYTERGSGPPVVLLHGNGAMWQDWEVSGVLDALAARHRVIAFDRPGFGHTDRPRATVWTPSRQAMLIAAALERLDVRKAVVVGHSWGALAALALGLGHRVHTGALVLVSGYYFPSLRMDVPMMGAPAVPVFGDIIRYTLSPPLGWLLRRPLVRKLFAPEPVTAQFRRSFPLALALRPSQIRAAAADTLLMVPGAAALCLRLEELKMKVVIVTGTHDDLVDVDWQARHLHYQLADSTLIEVEGGGHMVHHTAPDQVVEAVRLVMGDASLPILQADRRDTDPVAEQERVGDHP